MGAIAVASVTGILAVASADLYSRTGSLLYLSRLDHLLMGGRWDIWWSGMSAESVPRLLFHALAFGLLLAGGRAMSRGWTSSFYVVAVSTGGLMMAYWMLMPNQDTNGRIPLLHVYTALAEVPLIWRVSGYVSVTIHFLGTVVALLPGLLGHQGRRRNGSFVYGVMLLVGISWLMWGISQTEFDKETLDLSVNVSVYLIGSRMKTGLMWGTAYMLLAGGISELAMCSRFGLKGSAADETEGLAYFYQTRGTFILGVVPVVGYVVAFVILSWATRNGWVIT